MAFTHWAFRVDSVILVFGLAAVGRREEAHEQCAALASPLSADLREGVEANRDADEAKRERHPEQLILQRNSNGGDISMTLP